MPKTYLPRSGPCLRRARVDQLAHADNIEDLWFDKEAELVGAMTADHVAHIEARPQLKRARALAQRALAQIIDKHGLMGLKDELETVLLQAVRQYFMFYHHNAQIVRHGLGKTGDANKIAEISRALPRWTSNPCFLNRMQVSERPGDEHHLVLISRIGKDMSTLAERAARAAAIKAHKVKVAGSRDILLPTQIMFHFYLEHVNAKAKFWTSGSSDGSAWEESALCASPGFNFVLATLHLIDDSIERNALKELAKQLYEASAPSPERAFSLTG